MLDSTELQLFHFPSSVANSHFDLVQGWVIDFCVRIQGWVTCNGALTKGWTTENVFMIDLIFPVPWFMTSPLDSGISVSEGA